MLRRNLRHQIARRLEENERHAFCPNRENPAHDHLGRRRQPGGWPIDAAELYVGRAMTSITPEQPVPLSGQMRTRISQAVDNPVTATALALESRDGEKTLDQAVLVSCDLVAIREGLADEVRARLKERLPDFEPRKLVLSATHTHTAP